MMWRSEHLENPCFWCAARSQGDRIRSVPRSVQNLQWFSFGWMVFIQKNSATFIKPILRAGRLSCRNFQSAPLFRGVWEAVPSAPPNSNNLKFIEILEWAWQIWRLWCSTDTTDLRPAATVQFAGKHLSRHSPKWMHQPYLVTSSPEAEQHTQRIKTNTLWHWRAGCKGLRLPGHLLPPSNSRWMCGIWNLGKCLGTSGDQVPRRSHSCPWCGHSGYECWPSTLYCNIQRGLQLWRKGCHDTFASSKKVLIYASIPCMASERS